MIADCQQIISLNAFNRVCANIYIMLKKHNSASYNFIKFVLHNNLYYIQKILNVYCAHIILYWQAVANHYCEPFLLKFEQQQNPFTYISVNN